MIKNVSENKDIFTVKSNTKSFDVFPKGNAFPVLLEFPSWNTYQAFLFSQW
ncbi:MAG: hypothetical protein J5819_01780 [Eubacterium sp.]|nr:hypothetical protein [Eubacterium sp.]